jgi:AcrR family transcriptional regulator
VRPRRLDVTPALRARRREFAIGEIARTATQLFAERGFHEVTVEEIAGAAQISPRTFFRYFPAKEDVVLEDARRVRQRLADAFAGRPVDEPPITALRNAYLATSTVLPRHRSTVVRHSRVWRAVPSLVARANGEAVLGNDAIVQQLGARMGVDPAVDERPAVIAAAMAAAAVTAFNRWVDGGGRGNPAVAVGDALALLDGGLAGQDLARRDVAGSAATRGHSRRR